MKRSPYYLHKRGNVWYYRLPHEKTYRSTGETNKRRAEQEIAKLISRGLGRSSELDFRTYAAPYWVWESCPHVRRLLAEKKQIGRPHVERSRRWLELYVFSDDFSNLRMNEIRRADVLDLRDRLQANGVGARTVNAVITTVKTILSEAYYREDIDRDPGSRIGKLNYESPERGILTTSELAQIFESSEEYFPSELAYAVFAFAAMTGMRRGEILALVWDAVDLVGKKIDVRMAWKTTTTVGDPKWGKLREIPVTDRVIEILTDVRSSSSHTDPGNLVFCYANGERLKNDWWKTNFRKIMSRAGIMLHTPEKYRDKSGRKRTRHVYSNPRNVTPHSLRHSLNSHLIAAGCDPIKVQCYMGWSNQAVRGAIAHASLTRVQAGYTHLGPDQLDDIVPAIDAVFQP